MGLRWSTARFAVIASLLGGCGIVSGLNDLTTDQGSPDGGASSSSGASGSSGTGSSGASGSSGTSGSSGDGGRCVDAGAEICNDGIDNDCNGATDCADTACNPTSTCVPPIPAGWSATVFDAHDRPTCPAAYGTANDVAVILPNANSCTCACTPSTNSCTTGAYTLKSGGVTCDGSTIPLPAGGDCAALGAPQAMSANAYAQILPPASPSACSGASSLIGQTAGRVCTGPTALGGGCPGGGTCVPRGSLNGDSPCISHPGAVACPSGYQDQFLAGSQITDGRTCTACTCAPQACGGSVRLYAGPTCQGNSDLRVTINGTCAPYTNLAFTANEFTITPTNGCGVATPPSANGTAIVNSELTICCQPSN